VVLKDGAVAVRRLGPTGFEPRESTLKVFEQALREAGISRKEVAFVVATGGGRKEIDFADGEITDVGGAAKGSVFCCPTANTVIDVGAEEGRGIRCDSAGKVIDFEINEKCAAGAGAFTEAMSRALEMPIEEFGALSLKSTQAIPMNAQCAVFAESEVVSLIHAKTPKADISRAIHDAVASRIVSMVRKVGVEKDVVLIGGVARNVGFIDAMNRSLGFDVIVADDPEYIGALGAALVAHESVSHGRKS
jgi:benzoyl-CoA reductase subunit D